ncbi:MAG TPA: STAS domain-containing protein [Nitrospirota bacterium]|jgi:anti-anti-sigma regulatory factor
MIKLETDGDNKGCRVQVEGELTIEQAAEFKAALCRAFERGYPITVELGKVSRVDLTCFQIMCSAFITSYIRKAPITINGLSGEVIRAVEGVGLTRFPDTEDKCCWLSGGYHG